MDAVKDYMRLMRGSAEEIQAAFREVLICVTSFFRDADSFTSIKRQALPRLFAQRTDSKPLRIWVLGCSTGEEVYSLAMLLVECQEAFAPTVPFQIFATDLNAAAIEKARAGIYAKSIAHDVSEDRLQRFFVETDEHYVVRDALREHCIFARHDALSEPPVTDLDFISCRNLLIYLDEEMQNKLLPTLYQALLPEGMLWLGSNEHIASYRDFFTLEDARHKLYVSRRQEKENEK